jgi:hypothetical protein
VIKPAILSDAQFGNVFSGVEIKFPWSTLPFGVPQKLAKEYTFQAS